jgi:hypothetical protein
MHFIRVTSCVARNTRLATVRAFAAAMGLFRASLE